MWTNGSRARYDRSKLRYLSDPTDDGWAIFGPLIPHDKAGGIKRIVAERDLVNGLMYKRSDVGKSVVLPNVGSSGGPSDGSAGVAGWQKDWECLSEKKSSEISEFGRKNVLF
jgi:hypothetical protein